MNSDLFGDHINKSEILIVGMYINSGLLMVKAGLFFWAEFVIRPKGFHKINFKKRLQATFLPIANEEDIFTAEEYSKIKIYRRISIFILILLLIRIAIGFYLAELFNKD